MGFARRELMEFLDGLVELASEENKARAVLAKERFISDFEKTYGYESMSGGRKQNRRGGGRMIGKMYYDHGLSDFEIGWGQQFYVEYIYDHPGTSAQEMVEYIRVDKATLTKAVKKLVQIGYIKAIEDEKDRRIRRLYLTDLAVPAAKRIKEIHNSFYETLCRDIPPEEVELAEKTIGHMVENISRKIWHRMEES